MPSFRNAPGAEVDGLTDAVRVAMGDYHACALRATGAVVCWGMSIGAGSTSPMYRTRPGPITGF